MTLYHPHETHSPSIEVLSTIVLPPWGRYYIYRPIFSFITHSTSTPIITHESIFSKLYYLATSQPEEQCPHNPPTILPGNSFLSTFSPELPFSFTARLTRWLGLTPTNKQT